jgi:hypothetical protein
VARYDRVWVQQLGPRGFERVVVLVPGTNGGAGGLTPVARDIVRRVPRTQVWIVDRRQQAFEDTEVIERRDPDAALDHYLGFKYRHRAGGRPGGRRGAQAGAVLAHRAADGDPGPARQPPGPDLGGAREEPLPEDGRALPATDPPLT